MPKRPATPAPDLARPLQKSQRTSRSDSRDDRGSSRNSFTEGNTKDSTTGVDPTTVLKEKLLSETGPTKYQVHAVEYFVRWGSQPAPTFNTTDYVTFVKGGCPSAPTKGMATA
ncbi:hypothetical protein BGX34_002818 [Mortierella sp. NVP85]|nr:hypothetical protein BGX34_002818 [Mortierella sp. NVP85]